MVYHLNVGAGMSNTIEVKQVPSHMVWNDHGTGSNGDFSCWNPDITDGYSMLGSIPHGNYNQPSTVFVLKGEEGDFGFPAGYVQVCLNKDRILS